MFNNRFLQALGLVAACYLLLQAATWVLSSALRISQGFGFWLQRIVIPHSWKIALAIGLAYLLVTAATNGRRRGF